MADHIARKKLAQHLGAAARIIRETDGDCIAQTVTYSLFLEHWENYLGTRTGDYSGLIAAASDPALVDTIRAALSAAPLPFSDYLAEGKDPRVYFYEDFLRAYSPEVSKGRGVHYSPPAVVSYMVRGIEAILREHFSRQAPHTTILDPCCGTGTFLHAIANSEVPHSRLIGMELSQPVCTLASLLTSGCEIINADSLQEIDLRLTQGPLVVIGNPPYSGHSSNAGAIAGLIADYRQGLNERNPKWLQDDYVKFIRMAQHRIDRAGSGILAFITNHSYLVNPTFRAMRDSLMHSFDQVFALNLYGNALTNKDMDESDENIFAIRMGVAIAFMVKTSNSPGCRVVHSGIQGTRIHKLETLSGLAFKETSWQPVTPAKPFSVFVPSDATLQAEFYGFASLFDLFAESSIGFVTSRDSFAIDTDRDALLARIGDLRNPTVPAQKIRETYQVTDLDIERARQNLLADSHWQDKAIEILYRPFDKRWVYYSSLVMERPRLPFMRHMMQDNIALAIGRAGQATGSMEWDVVFCTDTPADLNLFRRGGAMLFPLYRYDGNHRLCNLIQHDCEFFYYIYALLHSEAYRTRYAECLAVDYPRIPSHPDGALLHALAELGKELVLAHTLASIPEYPPSPTPIKIGGWDIPGKYLKDRKARTLTVNEEHRINRIQSAVAFTQALQIRIDGLIGDSPPWRQQ